MQGHDELRPRRRQGEEQERFSNWHVLIGVMLLLVLLTAVADGQFIWTDRSEILERTYVATTAGDLLRGLTGQDFGERNYYRPTILVTNSLSYWLLGEHSVAWRLVSAVLHAVNAVAVLALLLEVGFARDRAFASAAAFLVHPIAVGTIAWAAARTDVLALGGTLACCLGALRWLRTGSRRHLVVAIVALGFALGAKPTAVMVVPLFASAGMAPAPTRASRSRLVTLCTWSAAVAVAYVLLAAAATGSSGLTFDPHLSVAQRLALSGEVWRRYAWELLWLPALSVCDATRIPGGAAPVVVPIVLLVGVAWAIHVLRGRGRRLDLLALLWAACFLLPVSGLLPLRHVRADRYLYLALPALIVLAVGFAFARLRRVHTRLLTMLVIAVLATAFVSRSRHFTSDEALWRWEVARNPSCKEGLSYLALHAWRQGEPREALALGMRALETAPNLRAYVDRMPTEHLVALALADQGRDAEALAIWARHEELGGRIGAEAAYMTGVVNARSGDCGDAADAFERSEALGLAASGRCDAVVVRAVCASRAGSQGDVRGELERYDAMGCTSHSDKIRALRH